MTREEIATAFEHIGDGSIAGEIRQQLPMRLVSLELEKLEQIALAFNELQELVRQNALVAE